jgi:hypothetical protein
MPMGVIQQLYFTHCTYGTSAFERRQGERAAEVAGYDVRASSLQGEELRKRYRHLQPLLVYGLPQFTPFEEKSRLDASTAPRRLFCFPSINGLQVVGQFSYRPADASPQRRPDSRFGHILFSDAGAWSVLDCLQLWGAAWTDRDSPHLPFDLLPLGALSDLRAGAPPAIDDRVLWSFLTTPPEAAFHDPRAVIPSRWKAKPPQERSQLLINLLDDYLSAGCGERRESVLLVVEPSLAALLFYGVARLLPEGNFRREMSFSTYEPETELLRISLAATTLFAPEKNDLSPDRYARAGFVCNTYTGRTSRRTAARRAYPALLVDALLTGGWPQVDRLLSQFQATSPKHPDDLEELSKIQSLVPLVLNPLAALPEQSLGRSELASKYLACAIRQELGDGPACLLRLQELAGTDKHLLLLELLAAEGGAGQSATAVRFLLDSLPDALVPQLLASRWVAQPLKIEALANYVNRNQRFPDRWEQAWQEGAAAARGPAADARALLPAVLARVQEPALRSLCRQELPKPQFTAFLAALAIATRAEAAKLPSVDWGIQNLDADRLYQLLGQYRGELFQACPWRNTSLPERLDALLLDLPNAGAKFSERLEILAAWRDYFPDPGQAEVWLSKWQRVRDLLASLRPLVRQKSGGPAGKLLPRQKPPDYNELGKKLADALWIAMHPDRYRDDEAGSARQACLRSLGLVMLRDPDFLPRDIWTAIANYYRSKQYGPGTWWAPAMKRRRQSGPLIAAGVAGGLVLLLAAVLLLSRGGGDESARRDPPTPVAKQVPKVASSKPPEKAPLPPKETPAQESPSGGAAKENGKAGNEEPKEAAQPPPKPTPAQPPGEPSGSKPGEEQAPRESSAAAPAVEGRPADDNIPPVLYFPNFLDPTGKTDSATLDLTINAKDPKLRLLELDRDPFGKLQSERPGGKENCFKVSLVDHPKVSVTFTVLAGATTNKLQCFPSRKLSEPDKDKFRALRKCCLKVEGKTESQIIALQRPWKRETPLRIDKGCAEVDSHVVADDDDSSRGTLKPSDFELYLDTGKLFMRSGSRDDKRSFPFGPARQPQPTHTVRDLGTDCKYEFDLTLLKTQESYQIRLSAREMLSDKDKEKKRQARTIEPNQDVDLVGELDKLCKARAQADKVQNWDIEPAKKALEELAKVLGEDPRQSSEGTTSKNDFKEKSGKSREQTAKELKDRADRRITALTQLQDIDRISAVLYRMVDVSRDGKVVERIRVDTVIIEEEKKR